MRTRTPGAPLRPPEEVTPPAPCPGQCPVPYTEPCVYRSTGSGVAGGWRKKAARSPETFPQTDTSREQAASWTRKTAGPRTTQNQLG